MDRKNIRKFVCKSFLVIQQMFYIYFFYRTICIVATFVRSTRAKKKVVETRINKKSSKSNESYSVTFCCFHNFWSFWHGCVFFWFSFSSDLTVTDVDDRSISSQLSITIYIQSFINFDCSHKNWRTCVSLFVFVNTFVCLRYSFILCFCIFNMWNCIQFHLRIHATKVHTFHFISRRSAVARKKKHSATHWTTKGGKKKSIQKWFIDAVIYFILAWKWKTEAMGKCRGNENAFKHFFFFAHSILLVFFSP